MSGEIVKRRATVWWTLTVVVAAVFLFLSLNDTVYNLTSPPGPFQILLRKSYSVVAFAIVGYLFSRALSANDRPKSLLYVATAVALYSAVIEIAQALVGAHEALIWNAIDTGCGFIGGTLGKLGSRIPFRA